MRDMTPMTAGLPSITQLGCPQRILAASNKKLPTTWQLRMAGDQMQTTVQPLSWSVLRAESCENYYP